MSYWWFDVWRWSSEGFTVIMGPGRKIHWVSKVPCGLTQSRMRLLHKVHRMSKLSGGLAQCRMRLLNKIHCIYELECGLARSCIGPGRKIHQVSKLLCGLAQSRGTFFINVPAAMFWGKNPRWKNECYQNYLIIVANCKLRETLRPQY